MSLPEPRSRRWQPMRAGLIDLFYYDSEEFWFRDGRLLLRGNNGTGKSKVLALTLPFLLDGDLAPHRVEPDADPKKRMEWNLLLGGAHPHPERLGYTWLEFGRVDEHGEPHFRTIGAGLKAVSGRGVARHWFFVTRQRCGAQLSLVDATGTALTRDRLIDALGDQGSVYDRAREYRRAVDETLFAFGEERYTAMVNLLIQLRQPQLSKRPSEKALSDALTRALPPLDQAVIADVAEAFRSLEEDRDELRTIIEARDAATTFLTHYRRYARIASRRKARLPRESNSAYERVSRDLAAAQADFERSERELGVAREKLAALETERKRLQARDEALRESPEMRSQRELQRAAEDARRLADDSRRATEEREAAADRLERQERRDEQAIERQAKAAEGMTAARQSTLDSAASARLAEQHGERIDRVLDAEGDLATLRRDAQQLADRQQRAIGHVRALVEAAAEAARKLSDARQRVSELDVEADDLARRRNEADRAVHDHGRALVTAVRAHYDRATEIRLPDPAATFAELELWVETLGGPNPAVTAVNAAGQAAAGALAEADAQLATQERAARERADALNEEIARLERGEDSAPPTPHTRDGAAREGRLGAPLWQLVDFADEVSAEDRAGVEAALEAAGILDAWVTPAGEVLDAGTDDVVLRPGIPVSRSVAGLLRPAVDRDNPQAAAVPDSTVDGLLASIGLDEQAQTWIAADGRFRVGVLEGAWRKPVARYIGRGAREAARRARLTDLRAELSTVENLLTTTAEDRQRIAVRRASLNEEITTLPTDAELRQAHADVATMIRERDRLTVRQDAANEAVVAATAVAEGAQTALAEGARDTGLPAERAALSEVDGCLAEYRIRLAELWPAVEALHEAMRQAGESAADLAHAREALTHRSERAEAIAEAAAAADERYQTLLGTVGAAVAELQRQLAEVKEGLSRNEAEQNSAKAEAEDALGARGRAEGHREQLAGQLEQANQERAAAADSFRRFAGTGLLAVALPDLDIPDLGSSWAPVPAVRLARRVNDELSGVTDDDSTWDRAQHRVNNELKTLHDTLARHGNKASADLREDGVVVEVEFQGRPASVPELAGALDTEVADRERLLTERERAILENHLVNEVASTLQELITAAEAQVSAMNEELAARPTSTGMRLRLQWRPKPDGPSGLAAARERLLRQTSDAWSEEDRAAVGGFLQHEIARVRSENPTRTWLEHLTEALDYRSWHGFLIERHQNGQWRSATGPASGGERVLAASVPLFAAASSHYASAGTPHAPRLVTLDEAFAGVDDNARAKYLGLLAAFDLDVVMTSEREWGCYPEVPGLAISQLSRIDDVPAVLVTNWEWDGHQRVAVERPRAVPDAPVAAQEDLWA
jgi:uncharacterized protein (TIGR02680 family)